MTRKEEIKNVEFFIRMAYKRIESNKLECLEYFEKANGALLAYNFKHSNTISLYDIDEEYHLMLRDVIDVVGKVRKFFNENYK